MATKTKLKTTAAVHACQSLADVQSSIKLMGDLQREHARVLTNLNDACAALTEGVAPELNDLTERIKTLQAGVQTWCEAHREEICGKGKTANLLTGEVAWRQRPPSVRVQGVEAVLAWLKVQGMALFIRTKEEVNKEAMLGEPERARGIPGVSIVTGVEDFIITPFELEAVQTNA